MSDNNYDASSIQVLSDLDHIKQRSGMYIGSAHDPRSLIAEALDNAFDEIHQNNKVSVVVEVNTLLNEYSVTDTGRGIPLGKIAVPGTDDDLEILEVLTSRTGSGAKFNNQAFKIRSGMNGVGMAVISALSSKVEYITTRRVGRHNESAVCIYENGKLISTEFINRSDHQQGVRVKFTINDDNETFTTKVIPLQYIIDRCKIARIFLGSNIRLVVDGVDQDISSGDILSLVGEPKASVFDSHQITVSNDKGESLTLAFRFLDNTDYNFKAYTNLLVNYQGGTHERLVYRALRRSLLNVLDKKKELQDHNVSGVDLVVSLLIENPNFNSQTKEYLSISNNEIAELIDKLTGELESYFWKNRGLYSKLIDRWIEIKNKLAHLKMSKDIMSSINVADEKLVNQGVRPSSGVHKLVECSSKSINGTEMHICEGNSAAGPFMKARDPRIHAILPLRGKILNVTKVDDKRAFNNAEVSDIINAVGTGIGDQCNPDLCRYEKIIISSDEDPDGDQIEGLVLGVFLKYLPKLIESGKVYISNGSLYGYYKDDKFYPVDDIADVPDGCKFLRFKGLGSMEPDQLKGMMLDPATRRLIRVELGNYDKAKDILARSDKKTELLYNAGVIVEVDKGGIINEE